MHAAEPVPDVLRDSGKTAHWHDVSYQCRHRKRRVGLCILSPLGFGIEGAALATGIGQLIPAVVGLFYFFFVKGDLYFTKFHFHGSVLSAASFNGASEMVTNIANAVITYAFNKIMLRLAGENGVAAITILLYSQFLFNALFLGFSMGVAPVISYNYGAKIQAD